MSAQKLITIQLRVTATNESALPRMIRLRRLLKTALRQWGFKCVAVEVKDSDEKEEKYT
jgi:hypothetical protein